MADRWLVASGDVATASNWNGGTLPVAGDACYADGFTGTFTSSFSIGTGTFYTTQRTGGTAGGGWVVNAGGITLTGNLHAGSTSSLQLNHNSGLVTINGNINGSTTTGGCFGIYHVGSGNFAITGNVYGGVSSSMGIYFRGDYGQGTITGNVYNGTSDACGVAVNAPSGTLTITGDVIANNGTVSAMTIGASGATVTINGNVYGGDSTYYSLDAYSAAYANAIYMSGASTLNINGTCYGGGGTGTYNGKAVVNYGGTVTMTNAVGGTSTISTGEAWAACNLSGTMTITGYAIGAPSGGSSAGVFGGIGATTKVAEIKTSATGVLGAAGKIYVASLTTSDIVVSDGTSTATFSAGSGGAVETVSVAVS